MAIDNYFNSSTKHGFVLPRENIAKELREILAMIENKKEK
jgi:hypothetical protein